MYCSGFSDSFTFLRSEARAGGFLYHLLVSDAFQQHAYAYANGSTVLHLSREAIPSFAFELPTAEQLGRFDALVEPLMELSDALDAGTEVLAACRDQLLPKLVSGQIRVSKSYEP